MIHAVNILHRSLLSTSAFSLTVFVILLAQSPFWLEGVPFSFRLTIAFVAILSFFRPHNGLLIVAGLSSLGLVAGQLVESPARGSEALVLAFLTGYCIHLWRTPNRSISSLGNLYLPVFLFTLILLASCVEQIIFLQINSDYPWPFIQRLIHYATHEYLVAPIDWNMLQQTVRFIEGMALLCSVLLLSQKQTGFASRITKILLAGSVGAAAINILYPTMELLNTKDWTGEFLSYFYMRQWTFFISDPNAAGSYFGMMALVAIGWGTVRGFRSVGFLTGAFLLLALWVSGSRAAAYTTMPVLACLMIWTIPRWSSVYKALQGLLAMVVLSLSALFIIWFLQIPIVSAPRETMTALNIRWWATQGSLEMWWSRPFFGIGIGQYFLRSAEFFPSELKVFYPRENAHNQFLQIAAEVGTFGLVVFLWLLGAVAKRVWFVGRVAHDYGLFVGIIAGLSMFLLSCLGGHPFLVPEVFYPFCLLMGVAVSLEQNDFQTETIEASAKQRNFLIEKFPFKKNKFRWYLAPETVLVGATILLILSLPVRVNHETTRIDFATVSYGLYEWETEEDQTRYRWTLDNSTVFTSSDEQHIEIPLRATLVPGFAQFDVSIKTPDCNTFTLSLTDSVWHRYRLQLPKYEHDNYRRIDFIVKQTWIPREIIPGSSDTRELGIRVGEIQQLSVESNSTLQPCHVFAVPS